MKKWIVVTGLDGCGLGNQLFQVACAVSLAEQYNASVVIQDDTASLLWGTCNRVYKKVSYVESIWNSQRLVHKGQAEIQVLLLHAHVLHNDYTCRRDVGEWGKGDDAMTLTARNNSEDMVLHIQGFCQHRDLFLSSLEALPLYVNVEDSETMHRVASRYGLDHGDGMRNMMIGVRRRGDFQHMTRYTDDLYQRAVDIVCQENGDPMTVVVMSDIPGYVLPLRWPSCVDRVVYIDDDDIVQMYAGLCCSTMILSESTFHYWIAVLRQSLQRRTDVVVYDRTDIMERPLCLDGWRILKSDS
jgi:hypothetical protein